MGKPKKLTPAQKNKVAKLGDMGVEQPRKYFIKYLEMGMAGKDIVKQAKQGVGTVEGGAGMQPSGGPSGGFPSGTFRFAPASFDRGGGGTGAGSNPLTSQSLDYLKGEDVVTGLKLKGKGKRKGARGTE